ncbi:MAG: hypothetical protein AMJ46_10280 [Latescibacteria bacterium DG_63]|nr:MAG: hypothetical protein AMJ46_10280 [Latescibacteria bacterium DG_63]
MNSLARTLLGWTAFVTVAALAVTCPAGEASPWNSVTLTWTAPGDDGTVGTASQYDIRYSTSNISGTDTTAWWNQATQCTGEPAPQGPGVSESFVVTGLEPSTTYYFVLRTADEVPNWSGFSNVAVLSTTESPDTVPPAAVRDLAFLRDDEHFLLVFSEWSVSVSLETQRGPVKLRTSSTAGGTGLLCFWRQKTSFELMADI